MFTSGNSSRVPLQQAIGSPTAHSDGGNGRNGSPSNANSPHHNNPPTNENETTGTANNSVYTETISNSSPRLQQSHHHHRSASQQRLYHLSHQSSPPLRSPQLSQHNAAAAAANNMYANVNKSLTERDDSVASSGRGRHYSTSNSRKGGEGGGGRRKRTASYNRGGVGALTTTDRSSTRSGAVNNSSHHNKKSTSNAFGGGGGLFGGDDNIAGGAPDGIGDDEEGDDGELKLKTITRSRWKIPLWFALGYEVVLSCAAFLILILISVFSVFGTMTDMVDEKISVDLKLVESAIQSPLAALEEAILGLRDRYAAKTSLSDDFSTPPCSDRSVEFIDSADFYSDAFFSTRANSFITSIYAVKYDEGRLVVPVAADGTTPLPIYANGTTAFDPSSSDPNAERYLVQCDVSPSYFRATRRGVSRRTTEPSITLGTFQNLRSLSYSTSLASQSSNFYQHASLNQSWIEWHTHLLYDPRLPAPEVYLFLAAPIEVNSTDIRTNVTTTSTLDLRDALTGGNEPARSDEEIAFIRDETISSIGLMVDSMVYLRQMLLAITPDDAGAHTTLYDLEDMVALSTTLGTGAVYHSVTTTTTDANGDAITKISGYKLYTAGSAPHNGANEAFWELDVLNIAEGEIRTNLDFGDRVVSAIVIGLAGKKRLAVVQSTPKSFYFQRAVDLRTQLIWLGFLMWFLIGVTCIIIGFAIRAGINAVQDNMKLAARMKNDRCVPYSSIFQDIEDLSISFDTMNFKLFAARAFMPQSLLIDTTETETDNDNAHNGNGNGDNGDGNNNNDEEGSVSIMTDATVDSKYIARRNAAKQQQMRQQQHGSTFNLRTTAANNNAMAASGTITTTEDSGNHNNNNYNSNNEAKGNLKAQMAAGGLLQKRVTIVVFNVRHFHSLVDVVNAPGSVIAPTQHLTQLVSTMCNRERGVIDSFHGDHFVLSFNATKHNAEGPVKAVKTAMDIIAAQREREEQQHRAALKQYEAEYGGGDHNDDDSEGDNDVDDDEEDFGGIDLFYTPAAKKAPPPPPPRPKPILFSVGISCGRAAVGHLGTATMKRLSIVGSVYSRADKLERMCRRLVSAENISTQLHNSAVSAAAAIATNAANASNANANNNNNIAHSAASVAPTPFPRPASINGNMNTYSGTGLAAVLPHSNSLANLSPTAIAGVGDGGEDGYGNRSSSSNNPSYVREGGSSDEDTRKKNGAHRRQRLPNAVVTSEDEQQQQQQLTQQQHQQQANASNPNNIVTFVESHGGGPTAYFNTNSPLAYSHQQQQQQQPQQRGSGRIYRNTSLHNFGGVKKFNNNAAFDNAEIAATAAALFGASASSSSSRPIPISPVQILTDHALSLEVQHSYRLQTVAALRCDDTTTAMDSNLQQQQQKGPKFLSGCPFRGIPVEITSSSFSSAQQHSPQKNAVMEGTLGTVTNSVPQLAAFPPVVHGGGGGGGSRANSNTTTAYVELFHSVVGATSSKHTKEEDEWLYQVGNTTTNLLIELNSAVEQYLQRCAAAEAVTTANVWAPPTAEAKAVFELQLVRIIQQHITARGGGGGGTNNSNGILEKLAGRHSLAAAAEKETTVVGTPTTTLLRGREKTAAAVALLLAGGSPISPLTANTSPSTAVPTAAAVSSETLEDVVALLESLLYCPPQQQAGPTSAAFPSLFTATTAVVEKSTSPAPPPKVDVQGLQALHYALWLVARTDLLGSTRGVMTL